MQSSYNKNLKPFARKLRKQGTKGEAILWRDVLKARKMRGYQFNRQFIIHNYIVELIIEIDGYSHFVKSKEDYIRQTEIEDMGYQFLRFSEAMVIYRIDEVVTEIDYAVECIEQQLGKSNKNI